MSATTSFFDSISCKKRSFIVLFGYVKLNNWLHFICKLSKEQVKGKPQIKKDRGKNEEIKKKIIYVTADFSRNNYSSYSVLLAK